MSRPRPKFKVKELVEFYSFGERMRARVRKVEWDKKYDAYFYETSPQVWYIESLVKRVKKAARRTL